MRNRCSRCGEVKSLDQFNRGRTKPHGRQSYCRECRLEYERTESARVSQRKTARKLRQEYPERIKARKAVWSALSAGRLTRPLTCSDCGCTGRLEADHCCGDAEEHWLTVEFVCRDCHVRRHEMRAQSY